MRTLLIGEVVCVGFVAACGGTNTRGGDNDATQGMGSRCDPFDAFDPPQPLVGFTPRQSVFRPSLTADELEMYFSIGVPGSAGHFELNVVHRSSTSEPFGEPQLLSLSASSTDQLSASVSGDGLILFFQSPDSSNARIYVSTRASRSEAFGGAIYVANANSTNGDVGDYTPFLTSDESELWFSSSRMTGQRRDIYRATGKGSQFGAATSISSLNSDNDEVDPVPSSDKLTIYFRSDRPGGIGTSGDIWVGHRSSSSDGFANIAPVAELNTSALDSPGWLSLDNCRLYFESYVNQTPNNIYVATRHPR